jgi:hypothetical protein
MIFTSEFIGSFFIYLNIKPHMSGSTASAVTTIKWKAKYTFCIVVLYCIKITLAKVARSIAA